jgi:hypothetical protein
MTRRNCDDCRGTLRLQGALVGAMLWPAMAVAAILDQQGVDKFEGYALEQLLYDSNLFRIPAAAGNLSELITPGARREDYIDRVSAGIDGDWTVAHQEIQLDVSIDYNDYRYNSFLTNTSGHAHALWDWSFLSAWTGQVGADYARSLSSFVNNKVFAKDLLDVQGYFATANYRLRSGWSLTFAARHARANHSVELQKVNDSDSNSGSGGLKYESGSGNFAGVEYRHSASTYPYGTSIGGASFDPQYRENTWDGYFSEALSAKTLLQGGAGYLQRHYPANHVLGFQPDFSGVIGHLSLQYHATEKTAVVIAAQRQLRAYLNAESDYFVSDGVTVTPTWSPSDRWRVSLEYSYERQRYLGSSPDSAATNGLPSRVDTVHGAQAGVRYTPLEHLELNLSYRYEKRDTNRPAYGYDDRNAFFNVRVIL